jgi:hypothetical protein
LTEVRFAWISAIDITGEIGMKKKIINLAIIALLTLGVSIPSVPVQMKKLAWEDLIPSTVAFDDPFAEMEREKLEYLGFVARVRGLIAAGKQVSQETREEAAEVEAELIKEGIDVDGLLARRDEIRELRKKRAGAVVEELDGASVKIPGYLLPLEYSGRKVTEFLLVPWVGACIHTPPPPPNQIVHVVLDHDNAFKSRSIYEPVWVAGEMATRAATKNLFLKDGSSDISIGYKLQATLVEPYKK